MQNDAKYSALKVSKAVFKPAIIELHYLEWWRGDNPHTTRVTWGLF